MFETTAGLSPFEVADLDADTLLCLLGDAEAQDRAATRRKLRYALHWCTLHPGSDGDHATWGDGERGANGDCDVRIGGAGTPLVAAGAAEEFAAALGITTTSGLNWLADALDLAHRLPGTSARLEALKIPGWKARRVAALTRSLPPVAASWVDTQLAPRLDKVGMPTIEKTVAHAIAAFCPDQLDDHHKQGRDGWHVDLEHARDTDAPWTGTSFLDAAADTNDLVAFHDLVCAVAETLRRAGDPDPLDQRKAKALGLIGRGQHTDPAAMATAAATGTTCATNGADDGGVEAGVGRAAAALDAVTAAQSSTSTATLKPERRRPGTPTKLYLHISTADLATHTDGAGTGFGTVERLGPATLDLLHAWLGHDRFTLTPVLDLHHTDAVDRHDPPARIREQVILRDQHCVGPYCHTHARACDLDHIEPYRIDGPPGQTSPENLAPLCRRHHRAKTFFRWRYHRQPDGSYHWTSPHGQHFTVTPGEGTTRLD